MTTLFQICAGPCHDYWVANWKFWFGTTGNFGILGLEVGVDALRSISHAEYVFGLDEGQKSLLCWSFELREGPVPAEDVRYLLRMMATQASKTHPIQDIEP